MIRREKEDKKMKKKLLAVLLSFTLALGIVVSPLAGETVWAEDEESSEESTETPAEITSGDWKYVDNGDSTITITDYSGNEEDENNEKSYTVNVPEKLDGKQVTGIGTEAFSWRGNLESITLPAGLTSIGDSAFYNCSSLTSIEIPASVTSIGYSAFCDCDGLTRIKLPDGLTSIEDYTFMYCDNLASIEIPASVTHIGKAFVGCNGLSDVYYGGSEEQWNKIDIEPTNNGLVGLHFYGDGLTVATIHYNSTMPDTAGTPTDTPEAPKEKQSQAINAESLEVAYGAKPFALPNRSSAGIALTYAVSDQSVAAVDASGNVTVKDCGITNITLTAPETEEYSKAEKTITLRVKPKKTTISSVKSTGKKTIQVKWKRNKQADGYIIMCATNKKFTKNKVQVTVGKNKKSKQQSKKIKKLKAGKKYYVRICAYAKSGPTKVQGDFSKVKTVRVKK